MRDAPEVSVCIPAYEAERWIEARSAPRSSRRIATSRSWSSTTTRPTARSRASGHWRSRTLASALRELPNLGVYGNFNRALALSRGRYIKFLCADDVLEPDCVERMLRPSR